ncbi:S-layer homology domain-containing protein [Paenibacillus kandeliae]|uniref:S-layer homology domain-containing protein n=1 Tax=Paenibacillus kandeliae TaxID=3231269 RepID=UPI00345AEFB9
MRKQVNMLLIASLVASMMNMIPASKVSAATVTASFTKVQANSNSAYLDFSVIMPDSEILYSTNFESNQFSTYYGGSGSNGNQSYVSTDKGTSLQVVDTITQRKGNAYGYPDTSNDLSMARTSISSLQQGTRLQAQYDMRALSGTNNQSAITFTDIRGKRGIELLDNSGRVVRFKNVMPVIVGSSAGTPKSFSVYVDGAASPNFPDNSIVTVLSSANTDWHWGAAYYRYQASTQSMILDSSNSAFWYTTIGASGMTSNGDYTFQPGEAVRTFPYGDFGTGLSNVDVNPNWITYSRSLDVPADTTQYDLGKYGANLSFSWKTNGVLQLDNFKIGYAQKAILYRDGAQVYSGYDSSYTDNGAIDKSKPGAISNLAYTFNKDKKTVTLGWDSAIDQGTDYIYTIQGQLRDGTVGSVQDPRTVTIKSGIRGYIVQQDSNASAIIESGQIVPNTDGSPTKYTFTPAYGKKYIHVAALDNNNNIGPTQTIMLTDSDQPQISLKPSTTAVTRYGVTVTANAMDATTWISQIHLPTGETVNSDTASFVAEQNGDYTVTSTDFLGNVGQKTIKISNIDQVPPVVTINPNRVAWQPNDIPIEVKVADNFPLVGLSLQYIMTNSSSLPDGSASWITTQDNPIQVQLPKEKEGEWYLHVRAVDEAGNEVLQTSGVYQIKALPKPVHTEDIQVTSPSADSLKFILPEQSDVGYAIEVDGKTVNLAPGHSTTIINGLESGTNHTVTITPVNASGNGEPTIIHAMTRPAEAQIAKVEPSSDMEGRVTASVYAVNGAIQYQYTLLDMDGNTIETRSSSDTQQDFDVKPNQRYELQVTAGNNAGAGLKASRIFLTVPSLTGLAVTEITEHSASLQWDSVTGDTYYELQRDHSLKVRIDHPDHTVSQDTYGTLEGVTAFVDTELQSGTEYEYRVNANNASGSSVQRNVTVQTLPTKPSLAARSISTEGFLLNITPVKSAESYDIYQDGIFLQRISDTQLQISNLLAGRPYSYQIAARNRSGLSAYQRLDVLTKPERVAQPVLSNYTVSGVTISFPSQPGVERWIVKNDYHQYESSSSTFDINGLEPGKTYTFTIYTENESGVSEAQSLLVTTLPGKLQGAAIREVTENDVTIVWQKLEGAVSYEIHSNQGSIQVEGTEVKLPTPGPGIQTGYTITPIGKTGTSPTTVTLMVIGSPRPQRSLEQVVSVTDITYHDAVLSWVPFDGAETYIVYNGEREIGRTTATQFVLNDLNSITRYNDIYMIAENREGRRSSRYAVDFMTLPDDRFLTEVSDVSASKAKFTFAGVIGNATRIIELQDQKGWYEVYRGTEDNVLIQQLSSDRRYAYRIWLENEQGGKSRVILGSFKTKEKQSEKEHLSSVPTILPQKEDLPDQATDQISASDPDANPSNKPQIEFDDIDRSFAKESIIRLANMGIIQGIGEREFAPQRGTTRAEFMSMIVRLILSKDQINAAQAKSLTFKDASDTNWYAKELKAAVYYHIAEGYSHDLFKPNEFINREQAVKMLSAALTPLHGQTMEASEHYYTDNEQVSEWAKENVNELTVTRIIEGYKDQSFRPQSILTRAECVLMLNRVMDQGWTQNPLSNIS